MKREKIFHVAGQFGVSGKLSEITPFPGGHIHESYLVRTEGRHTPDYMLQKKNKYVFRNVPAMMDNMDRVIRHLKNKISEAGGDPQRETITLIKTVHDGLFYCDDSGEYWVMCVYIRDGITYEQVNSPILASSGGRAIGRFQAMLSDFEYPLADILPGYHNMKFRYEQWDRALEQDAAGKKKEVMKEIAWIESRREKMLSFWDRIEKGLIPLRVAHNDTKISNLLFNKNHEAFCVIDLDTVMRSTVLNDFGDSIRTYANTGAEDDPDPDNVAMNMEIFKSYCEGYIPEASSFLSEAEKENMAFSAMYITFEQILRFLMDYIDGDKYYKIHFPEHNLVRTRAQYTLLASMEEQSDEMNDWINKLIDMHD